VLNKLAEMGDEPDRRALLEQLFVFMEEKGTPIVAVPTISKLTVDLYKLYHIVRELGGMVEVIHEILSRRYSSMFVSFSFFFHQSVAAIMLRMLRAHPWGTQLRTHGSSWVLSAGRKAGV